jgi:UDP-glucose 4-epimerase
MKTLVTGGAGFIGSHLVERLLADGHTVIVIDNFCTGRWENLASHLNNPSLRVVTADVTHLDAIQPHFQGVEWVFHLAALADIVPSVQQPLDYHGANVDGTVMTLEAARAAGVQRFVYSASSSCYGIPEVYPTPETAPIRPQYPYALTKYLGEQYVLHWGQVYHLPVMSLRLFNVYGPRARTTGTYGAVFGVFLAQLLAGKPCTVVGDGTQSRDFTFVTDVVEAFVRAAQSDLVGEVCNVGSGGTYSINHLVHLLGGKATYIPQRPGEPSCTFADIGKISRQLGWSPQVRFAVGVQMMLDHIEQWRHAPVWDAASIAAATREWFRYLEAAPERRAGV